MHFVKWPPVYMKHTLSKPALSTERLVYTKCTFEKSSIVSPTANAIYFGKVTSRPHQMLTLGAEPTRTEPNRAGPPGGGRGWLIARSRKISFAKKKASRLNQTHTLLASNFWSVVNALDIRILLAAAPFNERLVYVKHTLSTKCIFQRVSRLHQMNTKCTFWK